MRIILKRTSSRTPTSTFCLGSPKWAGTHGRRRSRSTRLWLLSGPRLTIHVSDAVDAPSCQPQLQCLRALSLTLSRNSRRRALGAIHTVRFSAPGVLPCSGGRCTTWIVCDFQTPRDAQPNLIYFTYGIAEVDSSLAGRAGVKGDKSPPSESAWLSNWFCLHLEPPNVIAFCPTALALMRLKFQSVVHQTSECWESPGWLHREPPMVTRYCMQMVGPLATSENAVNFFEGLNENLHRRSNFRLKKTSIRPMTPRAMSCDELGGEIYEWRWLDALRPTSSRTVADVASTSFAAQASTTTRIPTKTSKSSLAMPPSPPTISMPVATKSTTPPGSTLTTMTGPTTFPATTTRTRVSERITLFPDIVPHLRTSRATRTRTRVRERVRDTSIVAY
jgi:hypothetical protein